MVRAIRAICAFCGLTTFLRPYNDNVSYGWTVLLLAAAAMVGTLPGRTQGLGLVTEPLIAELGIGRVEYAQLNLWATLIGAVFAIGIGRFIDRLGTRVVLTIVALALGVVVVMMSGVQSFWALADRRHVDARARSERALGGQPRDGRPVVCPPHRSRDGHLQHRHEHRLHDRVPGGRIDRAVVRLAIGVADDRRGAHRGSRANRAGSS